MTDDPINPALLPWPRAWLAAFWRFGCAAETPEGWRPVGDWKIVGTGPAGLAVICPACPAAEA